MTDDKTIMTTLLSDVKSVCDLMLHGSIESSTPAVHNVFKKSLQESIDMQNQIYSKMSQKGWFPSETAPQQQIDKTKQKFQMA